MAAVLRTHLAARAARAARAAAVAVRARPPTALRAAAPAAVRLVTSTAVRPAARPDAPPSDKPKSTGSTLYLWVENLFNRVDRSRLLHEGPDRYDSARRAQPMHETTLLSALLSFPIVRRLLPRRVGAEFVLRMGGTMTVEVDGKRRLVKELADLPDRGTVTVREIDMAANTVTDVGAEHFADLHGLETLRLPDSQLLGDGVVDALLTLPALRELDLSGCKVSPAAIKRLGAVRSLRQVHLRNMLGWSDADRADVVATLQRALPECRITV